MEENTEITASTDKEVSKAHLFQKGDDPRRNLNGRPKGSLDFKTKWEMMVNKIALQNNLTAQEIDEQLLLVGYKKAKDGDYSFYRDAMDRIHGKPVQPTDITSGGKPIPILGGITHELQTDDSNEEDK